MRNRKEVLELVVTGLENARKNAKYIEEIIFLDKAIEEKKLELAKL